MTSQNDPCGGDNFAVEDVQRWRKRCSVNIPKSRLKNDNRSEATSKGDIGASTSASVTSEESSPRNNPTERVSKQSLLGDIAEYLEA